MMVRLTLFIPLKAMVTYSCLALSATCSEKMTKMEKILKWPKWKNLEKEL